MGVLSYDTFTEGGPAQALVDHTPEVGPDWSVHPVGAEVWQSNDGATDAAYLDLQATIPDNSQATVDVGTPDVDLSVDMKGHYDGGGLSLSIPGIVLRRVDATHLWVVEAGVQAGSQYIRLLERNGGGFVERAIANPALPDDTFFKVRVVCLGGAISVFVNGAHQFSYSGATSSQTGTRFGLRWASNGMPNDFARWDNWQVLPRVQHGMSGSGGGGGGPSSPGVHAGSGAASSGGKGRMGL